MFILNVCYWFFIYSDKVWNIKCVDIEGYVLYIFFIGECIYVYWNISILYDLIKNIKFWLVFMCI